MTGTSTGIALFGAGGRAELFTRRVVIVPVSAGEGVAALDTGEEAADVGAEDGAEDDPPA